MPKKRNSLRSCSYMVGWRAPAVASVLLLASGCDERDRLIFASPGDSVGPVTTIDRPNGADTTVFPGSDFFVNGTTVDPDGVDTVYFFVSGNQGFSPLSPRPTQTTVRFGIPLTTFGRSGETIEIQVHGVDVLGNRGGTSTRQIHVR